MEIKKYVYPKLPTALDLGFIRLGGNGLANCMFVAARAYILAQKEHAIFINPTWCKFSPGPFIRREIDKRHYFGLFRRYGVYGFHKLFILLFKRKQVTKVEGLGSYFVDILDDYLTVKNYFEYSVHPSVLNKLNDIIFDDVIGVHVRLGDYVLSLRTNIEWYLSIIEQINLITSKKNKFWLFSDGTEQELSCLTSIEGVKRMFLGNALADMLALSKTKLIIGSDSTFSGWSAYLGQVPVIFPHRHFGEVLINKENEIVGDNKNILESFLHRIFP